MSEEKQQKQQKEQYLVIVESPAKAKTIGKILGSSYKIESSVGHIRDLPVNKIGVNTRKKFEPEYQVVSGKEKVVDKLARLAKDSDHIYLATDPDREGEAIAWHLKCVLNSPDKKISRVKFNEITSKAIKEAFENPGKIDDDKVSAQQARRILDRLVGYKVSPLIRRKIGGRSAGRVQSVAVRLISEREEEIEAFIKEEYWSFSAALKKSSSKFSATLYSFEDKRIVSPEKASKNTLRCVRSEQEAESIKKTIAPPKSLLVSSVQERKILKQSSQPFITSTLQRVAATNCGFSVKKTMQIAQQLYEGIDIYGNGSPVGLITYMRTDSTRISDTAKDEAREFILESFGDEYLKKGESEGKSKKNKNAQDAHEAIRPTYISKTPSDLKNSLNKDQYRLYKLIWERFLASQMSPAEFKRISVELTDKSTDSLFKTSSQKLVFAGFMKVWQLEQEETSSSNLSKNNEDLDREDKEDGEDKESDMEESLPKLGKGDQVELINILPKQHFTEPPPRYNEASLVKTLEELGIGRPSTYASIISTVIDREYVEKNEAKSLVPTKLGREVNKALIEHFENIFETSFTAQMESKLDEVESAKLDWQKMLAEFYDPFKEVLKRAQEKIESISIPTDFVCPTEGCGAKMVMKNGFFGPFLACSRYPECKTTQKLTKDGKIPAPPRPSGKPCPKCNTEMNINTGRYGEYLQCPNEDCKHKMPIFESLGIPCPKDGCKGEIIQKKSRFGKIFYGCTEYSSTKCDAVFWNKPIKEQCPKCNSPYLTYKLLKRGDKIVCSVKECGYERLATEEDKQKYAS